jgi:transaldolase
LRHQLNLKNQSWKQACCTLISPFLHEQAGCTLISPFLYEQAGCTLISPFLHEQAGCTLISPFPGRVLEWVKADNPKGPQKFDPKDDPGVVACRKM